MNLDLQASDFIAKAQFEIIYRSFFVFTQVYVKQNTSHNNICDQKQALLW